ncbi:hypothetical protein AVP41_01573 [Microbacterium sp. TNHR37B]|nr:hypothetical protein AVP41_01573 [Microbacterium sp. TNHR37B]
MTEYFGMRGEAFPAGQVYQPTFPDTAAFTPPAGVFLVVVDDEGNDVGCGGIRRLADTAQGARYELKHLYLQPQTRGRGWGHLLLTALEDQAREWGAAEMVLDTHHTLTAAGSLYTAHEYTPIDAYNDNPNATVWLGKTL